MIAEEASIERAAKAGWNACRKSIYAVCEDVRNEADRLRISGTVGTASQEQHAKGYHAGTCFVAKSIARGFGAMEAEDDDNFSNAIFALAATKTLSENHVRSLLTNAHAAHGSYKGLADAIGVSDEFVRQCCQGKRAITGKVLRWLGFEALPRTYRTSSAQLQPHEPKSAVNEK